MEVKNTRRGHFTPLKKRTVFEDHSLTLYSIGWLGILVNRHTQTVRLWEYKGYLPRPIFATDEVQVRYYSAAELIGYAQIINTFPRSCGAPGTKGKTPWKKFKTRLHEFKQQLIAAIQQKHQNVFIEALPNEQKLKEAWQNNLSKDLKQIATNIIK
jgi:hypothetical protein